MVSIIPNRSTWLGISFAMMVAAIISLSLWGLKFGIDFTGGSFLEVGYLENRPSVESMKSVFSEKGVSDVEIKNSGDKGVIFRFKTVDQPTHEAIVAGLTAQAGLTEKNFESIGPVIGMELRSKAWKAVLFALVMILLYITYAFRKVSRPVASWRYGASAILALFHDLIILLGVFSLLGKFGGVEINSAFVAAFLTVLGFSVHDTIVVFDRVRENLLKVSGKFEEIVNRSLNETLVRSINTSLTVLLVLTAIYFFGGESLRYFALALLVGIAVGTYSSLFVASPLLVVWNEMAQKAKK